MVLQRIGFVLSISGLLFQFCCKDKLVEPPMKNPREYTWTIDTLAYPGSYQTAMRDIWASSPSDVYVVGHNDQNRGLMWHYDGNKWTDVRLSTTQGGNIQGPIDLSAIYGFGANSVFAVGERICQNPHPPPNFLDSSLVIQYDGGKWIEVPLPRRRALLSVWGSLPSDVWLGGIDGTIHHFDGSKWTQEFLDRQFQSLRRPLQIISIAGISPTDVYATATKPDQASPDDSTVIYLYHFNGQQWVRTDSLITTVGFSRWEFGSKLYVIGSELHSSGGGAFQKDGSRWRKLLDRNVGALGGSSPANLFAAGSDGVFHFNGTDWFQVTQLTSTNVFYTGVWTDGNEVFVVGFTVDYPQKTIILHGR